MTALRGLRVSNGFLRDRDGLWLFLSLLYDADPPVYPHIYGPVEVAAVRQVLPARRDPDGTFTGFG